jgi:hypothetical protein
MARDQRRTVARDQQCSANARAEWRRGQAAFDSAVADSSAPPPTRPHTVIRRNALMGPVCKRSPRYLRGGRVRRRRPIGRTGRVAGSAWATFPDRPHTAHLTR